MVMLFLLIIGIYASSCGACCCMSGMQTVVEAQYGVASYYGKDFHGRKTASGEPFNMYDYTCAHKRFPFGTKLRVTNLSNKKSVIVRVNDRGPFVKGRIIDLSYAAAAKIDMIRSGLIRVKVERIE